MDIVFLTQLLFKILFVVTVGFILKKTGVITDSLQKGLSNLLVMGIVPFNILEASASRFTPELAAGVIKSAVICCIYYIAAIAVGNIAAGLMHTDKKSKNIIITMITFANVGFIGFSLVGEIFGSEGTLYCVVYNLFYNLLLYTYGINLLGESSGFDIVSAIKKPVTAACILAVIIFFSPLYIPDILMGPISSISSAVFPISMLIIVCEAAEMDIPSLFKDKRAYIVSALRLAVFPLAMAAVLKILGFSGTLPRTMVVLTALPCGSMNIIFAEVYDCSPKLAAVTVVQSMLLLAFTLPVIIAISFAFL